MVLIAHVLESCIRGRENEAVVLEVSNERTWCGIQILSVRFSKC